MRGLPCVLVTAEGEPASGRPHERPDVLDPRAGERPDRLRPADDVRARRARPQVPAVRARPERRRGHGHAPLSRLLGLGAVALHGLTLVLDSTVHISLAALLVPGLAPYRPLWTALGVLPRTDAARASSSRSRCASASGCAPGAACTGRRTDLRAGHGPRPGGRHRHPDAVGLRALRRRRRLGRFATAWRALNRPVRPRPKEETMYRIQIDRSLCSGFGACAELAPEVIELDASGTQRLASECGRPGRARCGGGLPDGCDHRDRGRGEAA